MALTVPFSESAVPAWAKPPRDNALPVKVVRIVFRRPETAIPIPPQQRANQLRLVFNQQTNVSLLYIDAKVTSCGDSDQNEMFQVTFTTDPHHQLADEAIQAVIRRLTPEAIKTIIRDGTALDPKFLEVVENPPTES